MSLGLSCSLVPAQERKSPGVPNTRSEKNPAASSLLESSSENSSRSSSVGAHKAPASVTGEDDVSGELKEAELRSNRGQDAASNATQFISHLEPTADLMIAGSNSRAQPRIGIWVSKATTEEDRMRGGGSGSEWAGGSSFASSINNLPYYPPTLDRFLLSHLNALHAFEFPPEDQKKQLLGIYFEYVDPVLPVVDKNAFLSAYTRGNYSVPLLHAILMTSARHGRSRGLLSNPRTFALGCYRKIRALLYAGIETNALVLTRIYALLSLHSEGPEGFKEGARNLAMAFHYGLSLGIHLRSTDGTNTEEKVGDDDDDDKETITPTTNATPSIPDQVSASAAAADSNNNGDQRAQRTSSLNLWWSLWCVDLCTACINGMPLKVHPRDVGVALDSAEDGPQGNLFRRLVDSCRTLDAAINLYRPNLSGVLEVPELVKASSFPDDGTAFTALFRLIHYTSILLSYKRVSSLKDEDISEHLLTVALDVYDLVERYSDLVALPIIPYSVSITFSVFLRYFSKESVRIAWKRGCDILDTMAHFWWAAEAMASVARSVYEKLESECKVNEQEEGTEPIDFDKYQVSDHMLDGTLSSFMGQTSIFGELDPEVVDYWFPEEESLNFL